MTDDGNRRDKIGNFQLYDFWTLPSPSLTILYMHFICDMQIIGYVAAARPPSLSQPRRSAPQSVLIQFNPKMIKKNNNFAENQWLCTQMTGWWSWASLGGKKIVYQDGLCFIWCTVSYTVYNTSYCLKIGPILQIYSVQFNKYIQSSLTKQKPLD